LFLVPKVVNEQWNGPAEVALLVDEHPRRTTNAAMQIRRIEFFLSNPGIRPSQPYKAALTNVFTLAYASIQR
jgi:hypothetical protein